MKPMIGISEAYYRRKLAEIADKAVDLNADEEDPIYDTLEEYQMDRESEWDSAYAAYKDGD